MDYSLFVVRKLHCILHCMHYTQHVLCIDGYVQMTPLFISQACTREHATACHHNMCMLPPQHQFHSVYSNLTMPRSQLRLLSPLAESAGYVAIILTRPRDLGARYIPFHLPSKLECTYRLQPIVDELKNEKSVPVTYAASQRP